MLLSLLIPNFDEILYKLKNIKISLINATDDAKATKESL